MNSSILNYFQTNLNCVHSPLLTISRLISPKDYLDVSVHLILFLLLKVKTVPTNKFSFWTEGSQKKFPSLIS